MQINLQRTLGKTELVSVSESFVLTKSVFAFSFLSLSFKCIETYLVIYVVTFVDSILLKTRRFELINLRL